MAAAFKAPLPLDPYRRATLGTSSAAALNARKPSSLVSKIQSGSLNESLTLEAIIGATNCGRAFFGTGLAGPVSNQELFQLFTRRSSGR
jgi:hypothetical protein